MIPSRTSFLQSESCDQTRPRPQGRESRSVLRLYHDYHPSAMSRSPPQTPYASSAILSHDPWQGSSTTRLQALYSDFSRQKQSNPLSFQANVEWWKKALQTIVTTALQEEPSPTPGLILHADSSLMNLVKVPKVGKPLALGTVLVSGLVRQLEPILTRLWTSEG